MKRRSLLAGIAAASLFMIGGVTVCSSQKSTLASAPAAAPTKRLLFLGEEKGYRHEAVSHAAATVERLGRESGIWATTIRTDTEVLTKKKIEYNAKTLND